ncbi:crossover junction endonuclease MUS81 [Xylariales sp. PMI_506]|nr:crossover junction endonuclease MUS81 [Xylariales sp. PMI_506]
MAPPSNASDESCANPLLLSWVKEWLDVARERNSKGVTTYRNAYNSLKACPIPFAHPSQLQQLKGFGPKLCDRLTDKMKKHCEENGLPMPQKRVGGLTTGSPDGPADGEEDQDGENRPAKRPRKSKPYVPKLRSGPYAILMGMSECTTFGTTGLTKAQVIEAAQPHCDASFTAPPDPTSFYTAWSSMTTLINKEFVIEKKGGPARKHYVLTDAGLEVAENMKITLGASSEQPPSRGGGQHSAPRGRSPSLEIYGDEGETESTNASRQTQSAFADVVTDGNATSGVTDMPSFRPICLAPGSFTVHLVLDVREVRARSDRDYMQDELAKKGVKPIMRSLDLGDALWVAKCHDPQFLAAAGAEGDEVMLDWIVERKRLDDLIASIKDGRFHEQKFRLRRSAVRNVVYIVEEMALDPVNQQRYEESVQSAMASTQVVNGYFLKKTRKMDDTIRYLTRLTLRLKNQYEGKPLLVIPTGVITVRNYLPLLEHLREKEPANSYYISYPAFASLASKSEMMTLRDLYLKMLMCTRQVTGEKALEIQKRWKTPYEFVKAFEHCGPGEAGKKRKREMVFEQLGELFGRKKITKLLSQRIAEVWTDV